MAGSAPFGRDDQPLLDVKIIGGKRVEIAVDQYGRPLNNFEGKKPKAQPEESRFTRSLSEKQKFNSYSPQSTAVPPWVRGETPPKKVLRPLDSSPTSTRQSTRSSTWSGGLTESPKILPPITKKHFDNKMTTEATDDESNSLSKTLRKEVKGMDTTKLKDAYLSCCGLDSTLTGFVDGEQIEQIFERCRIPISRTLLKKLNARFMSARRPNWVNYEQLLKFINETVKGELKNDVLRLELSSNPHNSSFDREIPLKPNEISPRSSNDGSITGRQSAMVVKRAFQDRQDAHLLIEMERMLKQVPGARNLVWRLRETLEQNDTDSTVISSQKLKTFCLRHHLPFNGSLVDKILDRLDPRGTCKVNWEEFMEFVERALPLSSVGSHHSSNSGSRQSKIETPPSKPTWETRQPLRAVSERDRIIPEAAALEQEEMYDEQKKILDLKLKEQGQELAQILDNHQRNIDRRQKALHSDHIAEYEDLGRDLDEGSVNQFISNKVQPPSQLELEEQHRSLLQRHFQLLEQRRKIQKEQEELDKFVRHDGDKPVYEDSESHIQRFLRLANALFLSDDSNSGLLEKESVRRLVKNYNLVYHLDFNSDIIQDAIDESSTPDGLVSVDHLLNELKKHI